MTARSRSRVGVGQARRTRPVRRSTPRLSRVRAGAGLAMLAAAAAMYGASASPAFELASLDLTGVRYSDESELRQRVEVPAGTNLFGLQTDDLERRLLELPTVQQAAVSVRLPGTVAVEVVERDPILVWQVGERRLLVDREGTLFAAFPANPAPEASALPTVLDKRDASTSLDVGSRLDPVDLDAATRLGSLKPIDLGSRAERLDLDLTDDLGFVLHGKPRLWSAIFGFYTPSLRTPEMIPTQVHTLASLLLQQGEGNVRRVTLAGDTDGTFTTPGPAETPSPSPNGDGDEGEDGRASGSPTP
jgi:cell division septal protein FtsQ